MIFGGEKKFCQLLVATTEGPFTTVCLIMRLVRWQEAYYNIENSASVWIFETFFETPPLSGFFKISRFTKDSPN